jgi:hypothetical protein
MRVRDWKVTQSTRADGNAQALRGPQPGGATEWSPMTMARLNP